MAIDRTDHDYGDDIPRVSPRFGFELTPEMGRALAPALNLSDAETTHLGTRSTGYQQSNFQRRKDTHVLSPKEQGTRLLSVG